MAKRLEENLAGDSTLELSQEKCRSNLQVQMGERIFQGERPVWGKLTRHESWCTLKEKPIIHCS